MPYIQCVRLEVLLVSIVKGFGKGAYVALRENVKLIVSVVSVKRYLVSYTVFFQHRTSPFPEFLHDSPIDIRIFYSVDLLYVFDELLLGDSERSDGGIEFINRELRYAIDLISFLPIDLDGRYLFDDIVVHSMDGIEDDLLEIPRIALEPFFIYFRKIHFLSQALHICLIFSYPLLLFFIRNEILSLYGLDYRFRVGFVSSLSENIRLYYHIWDE